MDSYVVIRIRDSNEGGKYEIFIKIGQQRKLLVKRILKRLC